MILVTPSEAFAQHLEQVPRRSSATLNALDALSGPGRQVDAWEAVVVICHRDTTDGLPTVP